MRTWACLGKFSYLSVLCASLVCNASQAAMYVYPMETAIGENGASQIRVISNDNDVQFVKIKLKKILSPATKQEREVDAAEEVAAGLGRRGAHGHFGALL